MIEKLAERKQREADAFKGTSGREVATVTDKELFARASNKIKVVKGTQHGD